MTEIFKKLDFNEFKLRYKHEIRVNISWDQLKTMKLGLYICHDRSPVLIPHYKGGNWRDGRPTELSPGSGKALLRAPAVWTKKGFLLLDGCHRYKEIRPMFVVLDVLYPTEAQRPYFTDLFNKYYT